jgi:chloramphenicol O-acetyltransferase type A
MKTFLDLENWPRKDHFHFFRKFDEPFFGATATIDCTKAYESAKNLRVSFFIYYLHKVLSAVNAIESFRYRIAEESVEIWDRIDVSPTINREDGSFAFALFEFHHDIFVFSEIAKTEIERVRNTPGLFTRAFNDHNIIHFSALPWIDFTSLSHARSYKFPDSCPKISIGKMHTDDTGRKTFPVSVHVHHGLMDGYHVGLFFDILQQELDKA